MYILWDDKESYEYKGKNKNGVHYFDSNLPNFRYLFVKESNEVKQGFLFDFNNDLNSISMENINKQTGDYCNSYSCISKEDKQKILSLFNESNKMKIKHTSRDCYYEYVGKNKYGLHYFKIEKEGIWSDFTNFLIVEESDRVNAGFLFAFREYPDSVKAHEMSISKGNHCGSYHVWSTEDMEKIRNLFNAEEITIEMTYDEIEDKYWYLHENKNGVLHFKAKDKSNKSDLYVSIDLNNEIIWSINDIKSLNKDLNFRFTESAKEIILKLLNKESGKDMIEEIESMTYKNVIKRDYSLKIGCQEWTYQTWLNDYKTIAYEHGVKLNDDFNQRFESWLREQHFKQAETIEFMGKPHKMIIVNGVKELVEHSKPTGKDLWSNHKQYAKKGDKFMLEVEYNGQNLIELGSGKKINAPNEVFITPVNK